MPALPGSGKGQNLAYARARYSARASCRRLTTDNGLLTCLVFGFEFLIDVIGRADQPQVSEGLGKIAKLLSVQPHLFGI